MIGFRTGLYIMRRLAFFVTGRAVCSANAAAGTCVRQPKLGAQHYIFRLALGDASDEILGEASVDLLKLAVRAEPGDSSWIRGRRIRIVEINYWLHPI